MKFVLTNDDGIDAPGIQALAAAVQGDAIVVAPKDHKSGCSHQATHWERAIHVDPRDDSHYAVDGTPADCTRLALTHLVPDTECLLSGINAGGNLGIDTWLSGTVAAAREATFMGVRAIAFSQYIKRPLELDWSLAAERTKSILDLLLEKEYQPGTFWNVNLPHLEPGSPEPEVVYPHLCRQQLPMNYEIDGQYFRYSGAYSGRKRDPNSDADLCLSGKITITLMHV